LKGVRLRNQRTVIQNRNQSERTGGKDNPPALSHFGPPQTASYAPTSGPLSGGRMTERKTNRSVAAAALALLLGLAAAILLLSPSATPVAVTQASPLAQGDIGTVAIDTDPSGNTASALGSREDCRQVAPGETFDVDITIDAIPAVADANDALAGLQFVLRYDSSLLTLNSAGRGFILTHTAGSSLLPGATGPETELDAGPPRVVVFGNVDAGGAATAEQAIKGVAARLTFTTSASASGVAEITILSSFDLLETKIFQVDNDLFTIGQMVGGAIAVSPTTCSGVAIQPTSVAQEATTPPAGTTPAPAGSTPEPDTAPDSGGTPVAGGTPGTEASPQPAATQTAIAQATADAGGGSANANGGNGGIGWLPILLIILAAVAGVLGVGGWALRRRFRTKV